jgi:hypothetical protein
MKQIKNTKKHQHTINAWVHVFFQRSIDLQGSNSNGCLSSDI